MNGYVTVDMYPILFTLVGRNVVDNSVRGINYHTSLGESGKLFLVIGHKICVRNGGSIIMFLRNVINNRGVGGKRKDYA